MGEATISGGVGEWGSGGVGEWGSGGGHPSLSIAHNCTQSYPIAHNRTQSHSIAQLSEARSGYAWPSMAIHGTRDQLGMHLGYQRSSAVISSHQLGMHLGQAARNRRVEEHVGARHAAALWLGLQPEGE